MSRGPAGPGHWLHGSDRPLCSAYDVALVDLDGVVHVGAEPVPGAADALSHARAAGLRSVFVTNNAYRTRSQVAECLSSLGVPATTDDVVTSSDAAAGLLAARLPAGVPVLVLGGPGLREPVLEAGLRVADSADDHPAAVVQGYDPDLTYARLAEAALAVRRGALWVATNADRTIPTPRGELPGNGAIAAALAAATGVAPIYAGKPEPALFQAAARRSGARRPLIVGDRLDTDIAGALRCGWDSLLVLTGVAEPAALLRAPAEHRPSYLDRDLTGLLRRQPAATASPSGASSCGRWRAEPSGPEVRLWPVELPAQQSATGDDDELDALRAMLAAAWWAADRGRPVERVTGEQVPALVRPCG